MNIKYLPVGSVVLLNNGTKPVAIMGYKVKPENEVYKNGEKVSGNEEFDYCGCVYPEGIIRNDIFCMFNVEDINKVLFLGYLTDDFNKLHNYLIDEIDNKKGETVSTPSVAPTQTTEGTVNNTPVVEEVKISNETSTPIANNEPPANMEEISEVEIPKDNVIVEASETTSVPPKTIPTPDANTDVSVPVADTPVVSDTTTTPESAPVPENVSSVSEVPQSTNVTEVPPIPAVNTEEVVQQIVQPTTDTQQTVTNDDNSNTETQTADASSLIKNIEAIVSQNK